MAKLNISGYKKIEGLQIGDFQCTLTGEIDELYTFSFDYSPENDYGEHQDFFILVTIYRDYHNPNGFKLEVDFNIVRNASYVEEFPKVHEKWIYAHNLITLDKFKELIKPLLVLNT
jgi:hypothetical protein